MSWLFSRALVAEYLPGNCLDGEQCAPLSLMPTAHKFSRNGKMIEHSKLSQFGLTLDHLTASRGEALLTSFLAAFRAKTFHSQEVAQELPANDQDFGKNLPGLLAKYDPDSHSLKTAQLSLLEDSTLCSLTLPRSGTMRSGCVYLRRSVALTTSGIGYGYSPTLTASSANKEVISSRGGRNIIAVAKLNLPTLTVNGNYNRKGLSKTSGDGLATAIKKRMPTLTARDYRSQHAPGSKAFKKRQTNSRGVPLTEELQRRREIGQLNPTWCEWFMGWPLGWIKLEALETGKYQEWLQQHSIFYEADLNDNNH